MIGSRMEERCSAVRATSHRTAALCSALLLAAIASAGCRNRDNAEDYPVPPEQIGAPSIHTSSASPDGGETEGKRVYLERCASCHGTTGKGDGPSLARLKLSHKPHDYTDPEWLKQFNDDELVKTILYGGAGVGKSSDMPSFGDLQGKWELVAELVATLREFSGPAKP